MNWVALKMLTGDAKRFLVLVLGVAFASLLMAHQMSVFWGVMRRTTSCILDIDDGLIWVMSPRVRYIDEVKPLTSQDVYRLRGVEGVDWAVQLYKGLVRVQTRDRDYRNAVVLGLDDATLIGGPRQMLRGRLSDLQQPDAVIMDQAGYSYLWPGKPLQTGQELEVGERRARLVGICKASPPFQTLPILYTRFHQAVSFAPLERNVVSFVLVKPRADCHADEVCRRIERTTEMLALTGSEFSWKTIEYYFRFTGIPLNFIVVVGIGFVVGVAIAGQTFYLFTMEHLKQFGVLKAMGLNGQHLVCMVLLQSLVVGALGFGLGVGAANILIDGLTKNVQHLAGFFLTWQIFVATGIAVLVIVILASLLSIRRVLILEPAIVYRE
jgi:putative ABC transport system permease protein